MDHYAPRNAEIAESRQAKVNGRVGVQLIRQYARKYSPRVPETLASGQYRGGFTRAGYGGAEVDQGLLY